MARRKYTVIYLDADAMGISVTMDTLTTVAVEHLIANGAYGDSLTAVCRSAIISMSDRLAETGLVESEGDAAERVDEIATKFDMPRAAVLKFALAATWGSEVWV